MVARLFGLFRPSVAVFGKKDFQQAALVRRMVLDLELGVRVLQGSLIREEDGLAMSSRNQHLNAVNRAKAAALFAALKNSATAAEARRKLTGQGFDVDTPPSK